MAAPGRHRSCLSAVHSIDLFVTMMTANEARECHEEVIYLKAVIMNDKIGKRWRVRWRLTCLESQILWRLYTGTDGFRTYNDLIDFVAPHLIDKKGVRTVIGKLRAKIPHHDVQIVTQRDEGYTLIGLAFLKQYAE